MRKLVVVVAAVALVMLSVPFASADVGDYETIQLINGDYWNYKPQIDDGIVVWWADNGIENSEIFLWDGSQAVNFTNNDIMENGSQIDDGKIVWCGYDGNDLEIFLWDGTQTIQLTDNDVDDMDPQIDDGQVVWYAEGEGLDGAGVYHDTEIFLWDGTQVIQLTDDVYNDYYPQIDDGMVVWMGMNSWWDETDPEVFLWDGIQIIQISNNDSFDWNPQVDNGKVVWVGESSIGTEVFLWDGTQTIQVSNDNDCGFYAYIDNGMVVWTGSYDEGDSEIILWDGTQNIQLTDNDYNDGQYLQIDDGQIAWVATRGGIYDPPNMDVFLWDGSRTIQLNTDESYQGNEYLQIDDGVVVWEGWNSEGDHEIFLARPVTREAMKSFTIKNMNIVWALDGAKCPGTDKFTISGRLQIPDGYDIASLQKQATVSMTIANGVGTDTVAFREMTVKRPPRTTWSYYGNEQPPGEGMNINMMVIWWAPQGTKWAGWGGFYISGVLQLPEDVGLNTKPPVVKVVLEIPVTIQSGHGYIVGEQTVTCNVYQRARLWSYNVWPTLPSFQYDPSGGE